MLNGRWSWTGTLGFAIVVVSPEDELVAWGCGVPPEWVVDAAGAEAWALATTLQMCPSPPYIITDCLGVVKGAEMDPRRLLSNTSKLARTWQHIISATDGCLADLPKNGRLVWMPAHTAEKKVGEVKKSNCKVMTWVDRKANNLADHLAKLAASTASLSYAAAQSLRRAETLLLHSAAHLGTTTWRANNHRVEVVFEDGATEVKLIRDSVDAPRKQQTVDAKCKPTGAAVTRSKRKHVATQPVVRPAIAGTTRRTRAQVKAAKTRRNAERLGETRQLHAETEHAKVNNLRGKVEALAWAAETHSRSCTGGAGSSNAPGAEALVESTCERCATSELHALRRRPQKLKWASIASTAASTRACDAAMRRLIYGNSQHAGNSSAEQGTLRRC